MTAHPLERDPLLKNLPRNADGDPMLGGMLLRSRLGKGAMGAVYKGHHPRLNVAVAVKVLPPNPADPEATEQAARWFQREAQLLWQVQSTNVVRVSDVGKDGELHYMVMDYVHGMPLWRFMDGYEGFMVRPSEPEPAAAGGAGAADGGAKSIARRGVTEAIAVAILLAAARGLEAIHEKDIVHRDIKPDNILIPYRSGAQRLDDITELDFNKTQLVDLGIARQEKDDNSTQQGLILGTPAYMSPEQARGLEVTKSSDVYSLGATFFFLLAGQAPFQGKSPAEIVVQVAHESPLPIERFCPKLSAATRQLLDGCMRKAPEQRFEDGRALRRACEKLLTRVPIDAETRRLFSLPENSAIGQAVQADVAAAPDYRGDSPNAGEPRASGAGSRAGTRSGLPGTKPGRTTGAKLPPVAGGAVGEGDQGGQDGQGGSNNAGAPGGSSGPRGGTRRTNAVKPRAGRSAEEVIAAATRQPAVAEPEHAPDLEPAYGGAAMAQESPERARLEGALIRMRAMDDVYATWMALPIAAWGGLTVAGLLWNGAVVGAVFLAAVVAALAYLPFLLGGRFRKPAAAIGFGFSGGGWILLDKIGGILIPSVRRVWQGGAANPGINDWLMAGVVGLLALSSVASVVLTGMYFWHDYRKQLTVRQLETEVQRLEAARRKPKR